MVRLSFDGKYNEPEEVERNVLTLKATDLLPDRKTPWWFETGSPEFLAFRPGMLTEQSVSPLELEGRLAGMDLVSKFDVGDIGPLDRGAALPDRLPHHHGRGAAGPPDPLPSGLSQS